MIARSCNDRAVGDMQLLMDVEAQFRALFERAYPALVRYACRRGMSRADADDLVSATLETAWRHFDRVPEPALPWLYGIAHNQLRNRRRSDNRREAFHSAFALIAARDQIVESATVDADALRIAFGKLDEGDQELLRLIAWEGLTPAEAASVLGCSDVAARTRLHRARNRLARNLGFDPRMQSGAQSGQLAHREEQPPSPSGGLR
jgi:RNA polymerase sigma-70 factor (ECF subfamily)